ncbi:activity-regulated cytoskeleton associated protein 2-like [Amyelois transitella]|uniref:activity-regulated cytoskeleton associated protein 2-like n=1 Tax=Amyelois transitella TaxID=680683 RepID=UPI00298F8346|nr:activity-regulated cytoskeleton associated protein 2-like [Amyelois transitella]
MVLTRSRAGSSSADAAQANVVASPPPTPEAVRPPAPAPEAVPLPPLAPIMITTEQLRFLMERVNGPPTVSSSLHGNFAECTARFDGEKSSNVESFVDAIEVYKDCVGVSDENALRGLPMLLTGLAATWWQGVKDHTPTWSAAIEALKQPFGPRLPPHKIYRKIFEREQRSNEATDLFICHIRAIMSLLPLHSLSMTVQLDMTYGLLH